MTKHDHHAERLRDAATRLREVTEDVTSGPWEADPRGGVTGRFAGMTEVISESSDQAHADYIAAMSPPVALEMSLLLDAAARAMFGSDGDIPFKGHFLELADAVLGDEILGDEILGEN